MSESASLPAGPESQRSEPPHAESQRPAASQSPQEASPYAPTHTTAAERHSDPATSVLFNFITPLAILAVAVGAFIWFGEKTADQRPELDNTLAGRMQRLPIADVQQVRSLEAVGGQLDLDVDGVVVPFREVQIATEVAGKVIYKDPLCEAGNYVQAGQLLCRIDPQDYELEVQRLSRMREQEYEAIKELEQEIANAKRLVKVASEDLQLRTNELKRLEGLPAGFSSETELDALRRARLQALQTQVTVQNQLDLAEQRRSRLEASERLAAVQLEAATLNLKRTEIRSQISGVIVNEDAELNSFVQRGSPIITIEDTSQVEVAVNLRMDQLLWVLDQSGDRSPVGSPQAGAAADVAPAAGGDTNAQRSYALPETDATVRYRVAGRDDASYQWSGKLLRYDGIGLDPQTRTAPVRIVVENPERVQKPGRSQSQPGGPTALLRGMFVNVTLHIQPQTSLTLIPSLAMQPGSRVWYFAADPDVLKLPPPEAVAAADTEARDKPSTDNLARAEAAATADSEPESSAAPLDPADWVAGRVLVIGDVRAIESVELPPPDAEPDSQPIKYWICETTDASLQPGAFVVTSPLTAVSTDHPVSVRVPIAQIDPTQAQVAVASRP